MGFIDRPLGILGTGIFQGQPRPGVEEAYEYLMAEKALDFLKERQGTVFHGDLAHPPLSQPYEALYKKTVEIFKNGEIPFLIGGDHSQAFATVSAVVENDPDIKVIWVDAHGDINTPSTSPSGNTHGMPLSGLLNIVDKSRFEMPWMSQSLKPENVALVGIRDLDQEEMNLIRDHGVHHFSSKDVHKSGAKEIILKLASLWGAQSRVHISFDVDAMDSDLVSATGTPVAGGLNRDHSKDLLQGINQLFDVTSVEVVEFNPSLAPNAQALKVSFETVHEILKEFKNF